MQSFGSHAKGKLLDVTLAPLIRELDVKGNETKEVKDELLTSRNGPVVRQEIHFF